MIADLKIKEVKNFLPDSLANELHDIMTSSQFPWYWLDDVTAAPYDRKEVPETYNSQPGMHHTPWVDGNASEWFPHFSFMYHYIREQLGLDQHMWYLARIRCGLNFATFRPDHNLHNSPHVDYPETATGNHYTCLYYVNDSDGPTVVFHETKQSEEYNIAYQCHPEKNKLFVFNGKHYHASSCPKNHDARIALTINLVERKPNVERLLRAA